MNPLRIHTYKTRAIKKHKAHHLLNNFILYSLTTLACTSFCSSPLWYPPFCATFNVFFFFSLPKITSFFFTSKALFIVGNLIVIFLLRESNFFVFKYDAYDDICHDKYECKRLDQLQVLRPSHKLKGVKIIEGSQVKILESKTCEENYHEEFFELYNDEETCESDADRMAQSFGHDVEDVSCLEHVVKKVEDEKHEDIEGDGDVSLPAEELNKLVDDFIARINRQRRFEAEFCRV
ncbi:hypothetical protein L1987_80041 [Smallanthus sonchifolius]|uniref:Uncharacterized protein n=1 Tax=Smallanthus sonchifolius TaxID=185202 RepID=A0ACB8YMM1_9ASTR|nr:hypothetical protein L1987_80041 [Smallanthus sonchifolius]